MHEAITLQALRAFPFSGIAARCGRGRPQRPDMDMLAALRGAAGLGRACFVRRGWHALRH